MTTTEFWQQCYLQALERSDWARAKIVADQAVADMPAPEPPPVPSPVYRLRNGGDHFYTIDPAEKDSAISQYGYTYEGIAFYAYKTG